MNESAKQNLREAIREASSDILKMLMEAMAEPEGGVGIDQVEALVDGHVSPVIDSILAEAQAAALATAADVTFSSPYHIGHYQLDDYEKETILALSSLDPARYIERLRLAELIAARKVTCLTCSYGDKDDVGRKVYTRFHKEWGWQHQYNRQGWFGCNAIPIRELEADLERQLGADAEVKHGR